MKKRKIWIVAIAVTLTGCARGCEQFHHDVTGNRHYRVEQYSGGQLVHTFEFYGVLNNQDSSDGFYWFQGDTLREVSGDIFITSTK